MASIFRRPRSPFWFCSYRCGDGRWLKKSTKQTDRRKAIEFCHEARSMRSEAALNRTLTTAQARKLFNEILERAGDEPLDNFTVEGWLWEWVATKRAARGQKTGERYEKPIKDFLAHLGVTGKPSSPRRDSQGCALFPRCRACAWEITRDGEHGAQDRCRGSWGRREDGIHPDKPRRRG